MGENFFSFVESVEGDCRMIIGIDARLWFESGVGRYIRNIVRGLETIKTKHEFVIFLSKKGYDEVSFSSPNFRKVLTDIPWHTVQEQIRFKEQIEREKLDLMHFPYFSFPAFYSGKFIVTIHDLIIDHYPTGKATSLPLPIYYLKRQGYKFITKQGIRRAHGIIVPSKATKDELIKHYHANPEKIDVIYEGFDPLINGTRKKTKLVSNNYILYVGNAYPHKNLPSLLAAFCKIRLNRKVDLVCIGKDDYFYRKIKKNHPEGVYFLHGIDDSALYEYYKGALCLVIPSFMEGFGLPLIEAMNLSCPVVASSTPALQEIGHDAAFYFDPNSVSGMADSINHLLDDKNVREKNIKAGLLRSREFSWEKAIKKTLEVYESSSSI